jgi:hypothetical protein
MNTFIEQYQSKDQQFGAWLTQTAPADMPGLWENLLRVEQDMSISARQRVEWALSLLAKSGGIVSFLKGLPFVGEPKKPSMFERGDAFKEASRVRRQALLKPTPRNLLEVHAACVRWARAAAGEAAESERISPGMGVNYAIEAASASAQAVGALNAAATAPGYGRAFDHVLEWSLETEAAYRKQLELIRRLLAA